MNGIGDSAHIKDFDNRLQLQVDRRYRNYLCRRINLDIARTDEEFAIAGEFLTVVKDLKNLGKVWIRLNEIDNDQINLCEHTSIYCVFEKFFLSNTAQTDNYIDLLVGINFAMEY